MEPPAREAVRTQGSTLTSTARKPTVGTQRSFARLATRSGLAGVLAVIVTVGTVACVHVPPETRPDARKTRYFATPRELPPAIAAAIERGHIILGMDREQVTIVLGTPVKRTVYPGLPSSEVWLYRWARLHQDALRAHGATLFRLVFVDGLLAVAEPL